MKSKLDRFISFVHSFYDRLLFEHNAAQRKKFLGEEWLFYATRSLEEHVEDSRKRFRKISKIVVGLTCVLFLLGWMGSIFSDSLETRLQRENYDGITKKVDVNLKASYADTTLNQNLELLVLPKTLTAKEEEEHINRCIVFLRKAILGNNTGFGHITEDLNLLLYDSENAVSVAWESSMPQYINAQGEVNFLTLKQKERVVLTANLTIGKSNKQHFFIMFLVPLPNVDYATNIGRNIELMTADLNRDKEGAELNLPLRSEAGVGFEWSINEQGFPLFLIPVCVFVLLFLYFSTNDSLIKEAKKRKSTIEEEIPNLALQLILLLNAGLVVHAAFNEILLQNKNNEHPLYRILNKLSFQSRQSNESIVKAFYIFSKRSGSRNLIRFMTLVADHEIKGSELAEKLQRERDILWESRLQRAKAKAKETETKLCLPLMLLLLVLVTISISPALLEL